jgi:anaerobic glycerol-3-phosphate dehydrogenase
MKYDVIIIGTGLGGLVAGAKLSKEGKKVRSLNNTTKREVVPLHSGAAISTLKWDYMRWMAYIPGT